MLFFLYLALPQTEGSTLLFTNALAPAFAEHEQDIDAFLSGLRVRAGAGFLRAVQWAWARAVEQVQVRVPGTAPRAAAHPRASQGIQGGQQAYAAQGAGQEGVQTAGATGSGFEGFMHQPPAVAPQPPTLQDPASGNVAWMYAMASRAAMTCVGRTRGWEATKADGG